MTEILAILSILLLIGGLSLIVVGLNWVTIKLDKMENESEPRSSHLWEYEEIRRRFPSRESDEVSGD